MIVCFISIGVNALILTRLTDHYFGQYLKESYKLHEKQITEYVKSALIQGNVSHEQMAIELESHLFDPIIEIKLYNPSGKLLVEVNDYNENNHMMGMMHEQDMRDNSYDDFYKGFNQIKIMHENKLIGVLNIQSHSLAENSFVAKKFKDSLINNSIYSIGISIIIAITMGIFISHKMSENLKETQKIAANIQLGNDIEIKDSKIEEIAAIRHSLNELNTRLKLKQKSRKKLVDELVHQTRTPLAILKSHIEAIEDGLVEPNHKEMNVLTLQIDQVTTIISNMTKLIDGEKQNDILDIGDFDLYEIMSKIVFGLSPQFSKKEIDIYLKNKKNVMVRTDVNKLSQIIYNLLTNAYKYSNKGDKVVLDYEEYEELLDISVKDTGIGIEEEEISNIFNAYYRCNHTSDVKGDGLGLFIVKENIERLGGKISVQSKLGEGTIFKFTLPKSIKEDSYDKKI